MTEIISDANEGDTIVLSKRSLAEMGENARRRICPKKDIDFEYETDDLEDLND